MKSMLYIPDLQGQIKKKIAFAVCTQTNNEYQRRLQIITKFQEVASSVAVGQLCQSLLP